MFEEIRALIEQHDTIIIHRHTKPDGDALGSQMGLCFLLRDNFEEKRVLCVGDAAGRYAFMQKGAPDEVRDEDYADALAIILDSGASTLISDGRYSIAKSTARIDHHIFCEKIADAEVIDTSAESCCALICALAMEAGWKLSSEAATALYTGMVTDSGRFRYDSTSAQTFEMAAFLIEKGFDTNEIYRNLYSDELASIQLRAQFTLKINIAENGVAYIYTPIDEARSYGVDNFTISRGMVNTMSEIRGIDRWVNFTETDNGVLCEIRSSKMNINPIAVKYGGGGHKKASGATLKDRDEAMALLNDLISLSEDSNEA